MFTFVFVTVFGGLCDLYLHLYVYVEGIRDPVALPDDIRFVIEDEEVDFKRGFYPMVHAFMTAAI